MTLRRLIMRMTIPDEFEIPAYEWPANLQQAITASIAARNDGGPVGRAAEGLPAEVLVDLSTGLWRLRQKMHRPGTQQPLDEVKRAYRHLESVWDALAAAGVDIQDYSDCPFDPGMSLKVVSFQPTPGLSRDLIVETIKPSIYLKGKPIQMGEVIVATPATTPNRTQA